MAREPRRRPIHFAVWFTLALVVVVVLAWLFTPAFDVEKRSVEFQRSGLLLAILLPATLLLVVVLVVRWARREKAWATRRRRIRGQTVRPTRRGLSRNVFSALLILIVGAGLVWIAARITKGDVFLMLQILVGTVFLVVFVLLVIERGIGAWTSGPHRRAASVGMWVLTLVLAVVLYAAAVRILKGLSWGQVTALGLSAVMLGIVVSVFNFEVDARVWQKRLTAYRRWRRAKQDEREARLKARARSR